MDTEAACMGAVICLLLVLLFTCWLHACGRWKFRLRRADSAAWQDMESSAAEADDQEMAAHKFARVGLDRAEVEALPTFVYSGGEEEEDEEMAMAEGSSSSRRQAECVVCLSEFREGERGRRLPNCRHRFHVECIDTWLLASGTCPVCRSAIGRNVEEEGAGPVSPSSALQYPTNVLFWGGNSRRALASSGADLGGRVRQMAAIQIVTRWEAAHSSSSSSSSSSSFSFRAPPPPAHISRLNPLRRLLSSDSIRLLPTSSLPKT